MTDVRWLTKEIVTAIHETQIAQFGGAAGTRDEGLLESALARPLNLAAYGALSVAEMAATYAFGLACNRPFVDGNKRTAFMAAYVFPGLNGYQLTASEEEVVFMFRDLAAGEVSEEALAAWVAAHIEPR